MAQPQERLQADARQEVVQDPQAGVEHDHPDQRDCNRGRDHREQHDGTYEAPAVKLAMEVRGDGQTQRQLEYDAYGCEFDRDPEGIPKPSVFPEDLQIVLEPDEGRRRGARHEPRLETHVDVEG